MAEDIQAIRVLLQQQNSRVRKLEIWRGYIIGIGAAIAVGVSLLVKLL